VVESHAAFSASLTCQPSFSRARRSTSRFAGRSSTTRERREGRQARDDDGEDDECGIVASGEGKPAVDAAIEKLEIVHDEDSIALLVFPVFGLKTCERA
jgi:hypothetical protein